MTDSILLIEDDQSVTVALALAPEICAGCVHCEHASLPKMFCHNVTPCPYFHPANFYYDSQKKKFWCHNWDAEQ